MDYYQNIRRSPKTAKRLITALFVLLLAVVLLLGSALNAKNAEFVVGQLIAVGIPLSLMVSVLIVHGTRKSGISLFLIKIMASFFSIFPYTRSRDEIFFWLNAPYERMVRRQVRRHIRLVNLLESTVFLTFPTLM